MSEEMKWGRTQAVRGHEGTRGGWGRGRRWPPAPLSPPTAAPPRPLRPFPPLTLRAVVAAAELPVRGQRLQRHRRRRHHRPPPPESGARRFRPRCRWEMEAESGAPPARPLSGHGGGCWGPGRDRRQSELEQSLLQQSLDLFFFYNIFSFGCGKPPVSAGCQAA